ncbi:hypothetical protein JHK82_052369 [Glycine max]|nr:hypothetical protein JHK86_052202 [Glycine max]KAG4926573.1 hypothetical protein JHK85_053059 [Glycine max]KAG5082206.1 hypothetical protein JHK84_052244 [Glycine max]KAG5084972.1 hypothetical protein JHK82_052369 [Glycine max]
MGSVCCCLSFDDFEDYVNPNSPVYRNCVCLSCLIQNLLSVYSSIFRRGDAHSIPSSIQGAASITSAASLDNSLSDMYRSPPRPLPYDAEPRYFRSQRDGLVSRREKGSSHSNEETEPLRSDADLDPESLNSGDKWNESACEAGSKEYHSKSSLRLQSTKYSTGVGLVYASSEEEDVCPTCLEEYTKENPKIMTKCSHHFHLGCIYEWMERSDNCPVCGKPATEAWKNTILTPTTAPPSQAYSCDGTPLKCDGNDLVLHIVPLPSPSRNSHDGTPFKCDGNNLVLHIVPLPSPSHDGNNLVVHRMHPHHDAAPPPSPSFLCSIYGF